MSIPGSKSPGALLFSEKSNNMDPTNQARIGVVVIDGTMGSFIAFTGMPPVPRGLRQPLSYDGGCDKFTLLWP